LYRFHLNHSLLINLWFALEFPLLLYAYPRLSAKCAVVDVGRGSDKETATVFFYVSYVMQALSMYGVAVQ